MFVVFLHYNMQWDGKVEPRLLSTTSSNLSTRSSGVGGSTSSSSKAALMAKSNITNYAFLDEEDRVKLYVNLPGVGECADEDIVLSFTERSLNLTVKNYVAPEEKAKVEVDELLVADTSPEDTVVEQKRGEDRCLSLVKLYRDIENASHKKKADKIIVTLKKKENKAWLSVVL